VRLGYRVAVIDKAPEILAGTSSRNEGWLHAGTYHAASIADRSQARVVASRCQYGWNQIRREYPECVEEEPEPTFAIVREASKPDVLGRWEECSVEHRPARQSEISRLADDVSFEPDETAYAVGDIGINVRILAARLTASIREGGGEFFLGATVRACGPGALKLTGAEADQVCYRLLICSTGYATVSACAELGVPAPNIRLWRSHLITAPRLAPASVFAVAPLEAAMINHGDWSVVGLNEDASIVPEPVFDADPDVVAQLTTALLRRFPSVDRSALEAMACVKVDVLDAPQAVRSLNVRISWLTESVMSVLPGKMTETPYTADKVASLAFERLDTPRVRHRPIDRRALDHLEKSNALV
jgi:hypothetical protein